MPADMPLCSNPACRQPMTFLGEESEHFTFGCYRCGCCRVITKPQTREAAQYASMMARREQTTAMQRANTHRTYSFGGKK